ncbi:hypothetical protein CLOLEP_00189 [[Clostridium] leptum DSM 753]|uniref:Uncharacterized protein n=1 Tax=[Clostridium] leptum DSM 753 TaxID=428125 RepID=A7VNR3_9FIRM|nr:hypothetical protein CLOLEP_00189 [[Clostridium] leptum DSM 753]
MCILIAHRPFCRTQLSKCIFHSINIIILLLFDIPHHPQIP